MKFLLIIFLAKGTGVYILPTDDLEQCKAAGPHFSASFDRTFSALELDMGQTEWICVPRPDYFDISQPKFFLD